MNVTAGELLAWNVHKAAAIIREIRPDASIWVWSDMFDPMHNAVARLGLGADASHLTHVKIASRLRLFR